MAFTNIIGHADQLAALTADLMQGNVHHAYLLSGPDHIGKRTIAKQFAQQLLCANIPPADIDHCTRQCSALLHPDLLVLDTLYQFGEMTDWSVINAHSNAPQEHRKKKQVKTNTISIDDIRAMQHMLHDTPAGRYRVCIITDIERMNTMSANAFLKILEEPPSQLIFILTCTSASQLLPTVVSRTRVLTLARVSDAVIREAVKQADPVDQQFIVTLAQGAPGLALTLLNYPDALRIEKTWYDQAKKFWSASSFKDRLQLIAPMLKRSNDADVLWMHMAITLKQLPYNAVYYDAFLSSSAHFALNAHRGLVVQNFVSAISTL